MAATSCVLVLARAHTIKVFCLCERTQQHHFIRWHVHHIVECQALSRLPHNRVCATQTQSQGMRARASIPTHISHVRGTQNTAKEHHHNALPLRSTIPSSSTTSSASSHLEAASARTPSAGTGRTRMRKENGELSTLKTYLGDLVEIVPHTDPEAKWGGRTWT
eukprot:scaffold129571_cov23-Tisochrysis_lutea.AAC.1